MTDLTLADFNKLIFEAKRRTSKLELANYNVLEEVVISTFEQVELVNCKFKSLTLSSINYGVNLQSITADSIYILNQSTGQVLFNDVKARKVEFCSAEYQTNNIIQAVEINKKSKVNELLFKGMNINSLSIYAKNKILIENTTLAKIDKISSKKIEISKGTKIRAKVFLDDPIEYLKIEDSAVKEVEIIENSNIEIEFQSSNIAKFRIYNDFEKFSAIDSKIAHVHFDNVGNEKDSDVSFEGCSNLKELSCQHSVFNSFYFRGITKNAKIDFINSGFINQLDLSDSHLSNCVFNDVDFSRCEIKFNRSFLVETDFYNITWNSKFEVFHGDVKNLTIAKEVREVYRQLKHVHTKQENAIDAAFFKINELDAYRRVLRIKGRFKRGNFGDYLILWTNKVFGGYGVNIWPPLSWLFRVHTILFLILIKRNPLFEFPIAPNIASIDLQLTLKSISTYLYLLNPLHPYTYEGQSIISSIDIFMRVSAGYFIFYFLRASRKFH